MGRSFLSRGAAAWWAIVAAIVLFVAVNVIAEQELRGSRIDLTQNHLYTLSKGTRRVLAKIEEPITLRFYYSPQLGAAAPPYGIYAERVRETLQQYASLAHGKIKLQEIDPEPFSSAEDRAVAFGLQGVALQQGGDQVYFGLAATNATDDQQIIQFFQPDRERFLEYDLTKLIYSLAFPKKTAVGLISSLPLEGDFEAAMRGAPLTPYAIYEQMKQLYDIHDIQADATTIPPDIDVLMIVQPSHLPQKMLYAIDQYVMKGGKALVFVDPYSEAVAAKNRQAAFDPSANGSDLEPLFKAWGLEMVPGKVAADRSDARRVNVGTETSPHAADYIAWLALDGHNVNHDSPITGDLSQLNFATAGVLEPVKGATTKFIPLVFTTTQSQEVGIDKVAGFPQIDVLLNQFKASGKRLTLAARITGPAKTAFPDGPPGTKTAAKTPAAPKTSAKDPPAASGAAKPESSTPAEVKAAVKPINVVVIADTDMLSDRFWVDIQNFVGQHVAIPNANNGDLVTNAIDTLSGGADLIGLRTRGTAVRPFTLVQNIQRAADERYQDTEKGLEKQLKETQDKIRALSGRDPQTAQNGGNALEQAQTLDSFRTELLKVRRQLRQVQLALRQDIDRLRTEIEILDIAAIPILVGIVAIVLGAVRLSRRGRRVHTG